MQDIKPVHVFPEVAGLSSFAAAARGLNMTPASVTRSVARLEQDLGQQLLVRTTRQVALSSVGAMWLRVLALSWTAFAECILVAWAEAAANLD